MPKTLAQIKSKPPSPCAIKVKAFLDKNVKISAPYYENNELSGLVKFGRHMLRNIKREPLLKGYFHFVHPRRCFWSTPKYIKEL